MCNRLSWRRNYGAKDIKFGVLTWAFCLVLKCVEEIVVAVKVTMGPKVFFSYLMTPFLNVKL